MTDKRELKPCPFCRRPGRLDNDMPNAVVGCSATTHSCPGIAACVSSSADEAITAWNTRLASGDAVEELRERVRHWREMPSLLSAVDLIADMERALETLTTQAPAQTDENSKLTQPPPDRATPEERERRVRELAAKLTAYQEADKAPAQTEAMQSQKD